MKIARIDPSRIPIVIVVPMKAPTYPLCSIVTVPGALTAHKVDTYPFVNAKAIILKILNHDDWKSHIGPTSNATSKNVKTKITLASDSIFIVMPSRSNVFRPPIFLPTVSITLNTEVINKLNQPRSFGTFRINVRYEWSVTPGNTVKVTKKTNSNANRRP